MLEKSRAATLPKGSPEDFARCWPKGSGGRRTPQFQLRPAPPNLQPSVQSSPSGTKQLNQELRHPQRLCTGAAAYRGSRSSSCQQHLTHTRQGAAADYLRVNAGNWNDLIRLMERSSPIIAVTGSKSAAGRNRAADGESFPAVPAYWKKRDAIRKRDGGWRQLQLSL